MTFKTIFKIALISLILQSCTAQQSDFDLTQLTLKKEKVNQLIAEDMKMRVYPLGNTHKEYVNVKSDKFLNFNGTNLIGQQNPNSKNGVNGVSFYYNKKDSIIYKYEVHLYSEKQAQNLLTALSNKLGHPQFTSYMRHGDKANNNFSALLWEDTTNNHLYLLNYSLNSTEKAKLEVKNNSSNIEELNMMGPFGYWEDYLYKRTRKNNPNYSYQDFLAEMLEENPDNIQNKLSK